MGAWGAGPFENDDGAEVRSIWERFVSDSKVAWGSAKIASFFEDVYFQGAVPRVTDGNAALFIAVGQLFAESSMKLSGKLHVAVAEAIRLELSSGSLREWKRDKKRRVEVLTSLASTHEMDLTPTVLARKASKYGEEIKSLKRWFKNLEKICSVRESMSGETMAFVDSIKPDFAKPIAGATYGFYDKIDEDGSAEVGNLRYVYLVWLILFDLGRDFPEIKAAV